MTNLAQEMERRGRKSGVGGTSSESTISCGLREKWVGQLGARERNQEIASS